MSCDLQGIGVLVTRPSGQAEAICKLIAEHDGMAIHFPTIAIGPAEDEAAAKEYLTKIDSYQIIIFISPNAVRYGLDLLGDRGLPPEIKIAAVGKGTARVLSERGIKVDIRPKDRFDSESLLEQSELEEVEGKGILIVRGNGGRQLLADTLRGRGAVVDYAEVYSRKISSVDPRPLIASWKNDVQIATITSCETLENLFRLLEERGVTLIKQTPLVVVSERMQSRAQELGCTNVILATEASDQGLLKAICCWADKS